MQGALLQSFLAFLCSRHQEQRAAWPLGLMFPSRGALELTHVAFSAERLSLGWRPLNCRPCCSGATVSCLCLCRQPTAQQRQGTWGLRRCRAGLALLQ